MKKTLLTVAGICACGFLVGQSTARAQSSTDSAVPLKAYFGVRPWDGGNTQDALMSTTAGTTIPMAAYNIVASKNGANYSGVLVGTSPFAGSPSGTTIPVVVFPVSITIGTTTFNAAAPDACDGGVTPISRFNSSPLVQNVANLTFNGQNVGNLQYTNGFRKAEFWSIAGSDPAYSNSLSFTTGVTIPITAALVGTFGKVFGSGCKQFGVVSNPWLDLLLIKYVMPILRANGLLSTNQFAIFLVHNVYQSTSIPPNILTCCILGYHGATGNPVQTYSVINWDSTGVFGVASNDAAIGSHEIAEWMDDPLGTNLTPPWGNVGQVLFVCQGNLENGDALSGTDMPTITMNGFNYHTQELTFFSWFFNSATTPSYGTGGLFSGNGTFKGPAKACPPGGTN